MSGTLTISGMQAGLPSGEQITGPITMTGSSVVEWSESTQLNSGDNTFTLPTGVTCTAMLIVLGSGGVAATIKARTNLNSGDAGLPVAPFSGIGFAVFPLTPGVTSVILNASTTVTPVSLLLI